MPSMVEGARSAHSLAQRIAATQHAPSTAQTRGPPPPLRGGGKTISSSRRICARVLQAHDPEKACPGLDPGWSPVFGQDHAQLKNITNGLPMRGGGAPKGAPTIGRAPQTSLRSLRKPSASARQRALRGRARLPALHRGSRLGDRTPPLNLGPRFLESPDANGLLARSGASAASSSRTGHTLAGLSEAKSGLLLYPPPRRESERGRGTTRSSRSERRVVEGACGEEEIVVADAPSTALARLKITPLPNPPPQACSRARDKRGPVWGRE